MTKILIIRHGNTFNPDDTPTRVGCRTDIPLTQSGIEQARALGNFIKHENLLPDTIYASELQRAQETATIMAHDANLSVAIQTDKTFNEIDHGPDENKTEADIIARIGKKGLEDWDHYNVVPDGWNVDPRAIQQSWIDFADDCLKNRNGETTCVVSSGGIIRFSPILLGEPIDNPKVKTASMSLFTHNGESWECAFWNKRPD
jgi:2,3-bisphosphoglycerate-dependent phosphoglycerate mutase